MYSLADLPSESCCKQIIYELLTKKKLCSCGHKIAWKRNRDYGWCKNCRVKIRPKAKTWLRSSKLSYQTIFKLLYCWQSRQSPGASRLATGLSYTTIARWYKRFREHLPADGGELLSGIVAVDEAWFGKRRYGKQTIVIGAIETNSRKLRLQVIPDTEQDSIELFLQNWVAKDSLLITDCAQGYSDVEWLGYGREAYNHSKGHFGQTNHIECVWGAMKRHMRKLYGSIPTNNLEYLLSEWMARHNQRSLFETPENYLKATIVPD